MSSRQHEEESITGKAARLALMGITSAGVGSALGHGLDGLFPGADPVDVTGLHGAQVDDGSVLHHGPSEGGDLLDRPSAGYMAHSSAGNGLELQQDGDVSQIARDIDKAGTFTIDGQEISVLDYVPGGDYVQMAAGNVNPSQLAMGLLHHGMERQMRMGEDISEVQGEDGTVEVGLMVARGQSSGVATEAGMQNGQDHEENALVMEEGFGRGEDASADTVVITSARGSGSVAKGPDADQNARDMESLALQHRMDLDTAVQTSDQQTVHTQMHAHGRTLEVETNFEATAPDNREEREEAAEHVQDVAHSAMTETESSRPDMHFRSRVMAHLDAQARDEGISI